MEKLERCQNCGAKVLQEEMVETTIGLICSDCETEFTTCSHCGRIFPEKEAYEAESGIICMECYESFYSTCYNCGIATTETMGTADGYLLCSHCYEYTNICENCGERFFEELNEDNFCSYCEEKLEEIINEYYYKPEPIFHGSGDWYYGVELEIGEIYKNKFSLAEKLLNEFEGLIYLKEDGSLNSGFEIVSHPLTLDYLYNSKLFEKIEENFRGKARAFNKGGMHIHVSREAFRNDKEFKKFFYFINEHKKFISFIAQRKSNHWAYLKKMPSEWKKLEEYKEQDYNRNTDRYTAVNLENIHTIEVRIFNANIIAARNYKNIEFIDALIHFVKAGYGVDNPKNFVNWIMKFKKKYKHLREFLKERENKLNEIL